MTEQRLHDVIESCRQSGAWAKLVHVIGSVFIDPEALMYSFITNSCSDNVTLSKKYEEVMVVDEHKDHDNMVTFTVGCVETLTPASSRILCFSHFAIKHK